MKKSKLRILSIVLALSIIIASVPLTMASAKTTKAEFGLISDIHYLADSIKGDFCDAYKDFNYYASKEYTCNNSLLSNALLGIETVLKNAEEADLKFLLIPGDLTKDGEYDSHVELAQKLENWQTRTGIPVYVINGNHDVNNSNVNTFADGTKKAGRKTSPEDFKNIYKNLGYDKADAFYTPRGYSEAANGIKGGMLSYAADLGDAYRLIAVDCGMYSVDNGAKSTEHLTDGRVGNGLLDWVLSQARTARQNGKIPIVLQHHNLVPHMDIEEATFWAFVVQDWERIADAYADAGIHYVFTGHLHASDTNSYVSDKGETVTDVLTPTLTGYPNYFRTATLSTDGDNVTLNLTNYDIDDASLGLPKIYSDFGETYERPYKYTKSFPDTFGKTIDEFLERTMKKLIDQYFTQISDAGGLVPFLKQKNIDVQALLTDLLGTDGLAVGDMDILTISTNAMSFINDLDSQIMTEYINKPDETLDTVMRLINKILSLKLSDYPCTYNYEVLGGTPTGEGCTFGEFATSVLLLYYAGDENVYGKDGYEYIKDILDGFDSGEVTQDFFELLIDVLLHDLIEDEILGHIDFNPGKLFPDGTALSLLGKLLQSITEQLLGGNNSLLNLIESVLGLSIVPDDYGSIEDILNTLLIDRYLTKSQYESWGATISWMVKSLVVDDDPSPVNDNNITVTYNGPVEVEATKENFRLPSNIVMNLTDDSTSVVISWLTKYSITDTDIELVTYSESPAFTGKATKGSNIKTKAERVSRSYPGADLGIIGFLDLNKTYIEHTVTLTDLTPGAKYSYRVGSEKRNWWSDTGTIKVSAGEDEAFTFFNITDPQAQRASHYETYSNVMNAARELYPDARFVTSCGDQVDLGVNSKHWNLFFNSTDAFLDMPFMPATGNHEKKGSALKTNFNLPNVPEQDETTGTYYSYDYNNVHFTVLNANDMDDKKLSDKQIDWMIKDIQSSDAKWKIVIIHKTLYCNGIYYSDKETVNLRNQLAALLPYLGVDMLLSGHNHVYTRTGVMDSGAVVPTKTKTVSYNGEEYEAKINPKGTIYNIIGQAGIKEYKTIPQKETSKYFPEAECYLDETRTMFSAITVDGDYLYFNAYALDDSNKAEKVDSFAIEKTDDTDPDDKITNEGVNNLITKLLSKLNIKLTWKIRNFFSRIWGAILSVLWKFGL